MVVQQAESEPQDHADWSGYYGVLAKRARLGSLLSNRDIPVKCRTSLDNLYEVCVRSMAAVRSRDVGVDAAADKVAEGVR